MNVLDVGANLGYFVRPTMENCHGVSALTKAINQEGAAGTGTADNQSAFHRGRWWHALRARGRRMLRFVHGGRTFDFVKLLRVVPKNLAADRCFAI